MYPPFSFQYLIDIMDTENTEQQEPIKTAIPVVQKVYTIRDWKEYVGEALLIIFSVLLALIVTEYLSGLHEKENTKEQLKNIVAELTKNKAYIKEMQVYNAKVLANIDSILANKSLQDELLTNDVFHLKKIAPDGVLYRYLDKDAWTIAKSNNIFSKIDIETSSLLNNVYEDIDRTLKVEDEVAKVILQRESRDPKQIHTTLILIRDLYHGWAVDRSDGLLMQIDKSIQKLSSE